ncbi:MAG: CaiB/BaiF CoA transferase family protein [Lautropia sp.]
MRILDMATVLAAPFAATLCADLGADVIKLELPDGSDAMRALSPVKDGVALYWKVTNRGKRGITLDVRQPEGRALFLHLLRDIDVLVENFRPGTMDRWGLDAATLFGVNPRLVVLRLTGFGQTGPARARPGFARIFEAMSGFTHLNGQPDGPPLHMNFPVGDAVAGVFGAFAIAAEMVRMRSDPRASGAEIDLSATEAMLRMLDPLAVEYEQLGQVRTRNGNLASYTAPSNMYASADGRWFSLVASSETIYRRMCDAIGMPQLATDPRFASNPLRVKHVAALDATLAAWFGARPYAEIAATLDAAQVPFQPTQTIEDVLRDPHFAAREAIVRLPDPDLGSIPAPCIVPRVVGRAMPIPRSGPAVGEHNDAVWGGLGVDAVRLASLRERKIV